MRVNALNRLLLISTVVYCGYDVEKDIVSMPSTGFYSFLRICRNPFCQGNCFVSMPSTGFYSFLLSKLLKDFVRRDLCQCPQRASTHFYSVTENQIEEIIDMCQCPQRASTHFYDDVLAPGALIRVSMPSTGFYLFLLSAARVPSSRAGSVSMPSTGFYLFLR